MNIKQIISEELKKIYEQYDNDITKSLWGLVKYNGGYFKSDKQKNYFFNQLKRQQNDSEKHGFGRGESLYVKGGDIYGNPYSYAFYFDNDGIIKVEKNTNKGGTKLMWERNAENTKKSKDLVFNTNLNKKFNNAVNIFIQNANDKVQNLINNKLTELEKKYPTQKPLIKSFFYNEINNFSNEIKKRLDDLNKKENNEIFNILREIYSFILESRKNNLMPHIGDEFISYHPQIHKTDVDGNITNELLPQYKTSEGKQNFINQINP